MKYGLMVVPQNDFAHILKNTRSIVKLKVIIDAGFDHVVVGSTLYVPESEFWGFIKNNIN